MYLDEAAALFAFIFSRVARYTPSYYIKNPRIILKNHSQLIFASYLLPYYLFYKSNQCNPNITNSTMRSSPSLWSQDGAHAASFLKKLQYEINHIPNTGA